MKLERFVIRYLEGAESPVLYERGDYVLSHLVPEHTTRRVYVIDADQEDAKRCENCTFWKFNQPGDSWGDCYGGLAKELPCCLRAPRDFCCKDFEGRK